MALELGIIIIIIIIIIVSAYPMASEVSRAYSY